MAIPQFLANWKTTRSHTMLAGGRSVQVKIEKGSFAGRIVRWLQPKTFREHRISNLQTFFRQVNQFNRADNPIGSKVLSEEFHREFPLLNNNPAKVNFMPSRLTAEKVRKVFFKLNWHIAKANSSAGRNTAAPPAADSTYAAQPRPPRQTLQTPQAPQASRASQQASQAPQASRASQQASQAPQASQQVSQAPQQAPQAPQDSQAAPQAQEPAASETPPPRPAPSWKPQGTYARDQLRELTPKLREYVNFLAKNRDQIPEDLQFKEKRLFPDLMAGLVRKHFPLPASSASRQPVEQEAQAARQEAPPAQTARASDAPAPDAPGRAPFRIRPDPNANTRAFGTELSPDPLPPGRDFYKEKQADSSGLCGMYALNAFCGGPVIGQQEYEDAVCTHVAGVIGMTPEDYRAALGGVFSSSPASIAHILSDMAGKERADPSCARVKVEEGLIVPPPDTAAHQRMIEKINAFPGDRLMLSYSKGHGSAGHVIALRRDTAGNWRQLNSLDFVSQKEIPNLGDYITGLQGVSLIHIEPEFSFKEPQAA